MNQLNAPCINNVGNKIKKGQMSTIHILHWLTSRRQYIASTKQTKHMEYIQRPAMRFIFQDKSDTETITAANLPTLSDRRKKLCRTLFISTQQSTHKLHHRLPPPGKLRIQLETRGLTVCRVAELQYFRTLLYHML